MQTCPAPRGQAPHGRGPGGRRRSAHLPGYVWQNRRATERPAVPSGPPLDRAGGPMETSPGRTRRSGGHARSRTRCCERATPAAAPPQHRAPRRRLAGGDAGRDPVLVAPRCSPPGPPARRSCSAAERPSCSAGTTPARARPEPRHRPSAATSVVPTAPTVRGRRAPVTTVRAPASRPPPSPPRRPPDGHRRRTGGAGGAPDGSSRRQPRAAAEHARGRRGGGGAWRRGRGARRAAALAAVVGAWYDTGTATRVRAGLDAQSEASRATPERSRPGTAPAPTRPGREMGAVSRALGAVLDPVTGGRIADYVPPQDAAQYRAYVDGLDAGDAAGAGAAAQWLRGRLAREGVALAPAAPGAGPVRRTDPRDGQRECIVTVVRLRVRDRLAVEGAVGLLDQLDHVSRVGSAGSGPSSAGRAGATSAPPSASLVQLPVSRRSAQRPPPRAPAARRARPPGSALPHSSSTSRSSASR